MCPFVGGGQLFLVADPVAYAFANKGQGRGVVNLYFEHHIRTDCVLYRGFSSSPLTELKGAISLAVFKDSFGS